MRFSELESNLARILFLEEEILPNKLLLATKQGTPTTAYLQFFRQRCFLRGVAGVQESLNPANLISNLYSFLV